MGCFNIQGCISQLPIELNDRVAGIFCKIHSTLDFTNTLTCTNYRLYPMCPIIYGTYNDYGGLIPDESETTKLLESFFGYNIDNIIDDFVALTLNGDINSKGLNKLIVDRDMSEPRTIRVFKNAPQLEDYDILYNHWCLVLEHEDIIKTIINNNNEITKYCSPNIKCINWDDMYDEQLKLFQKHNLDKYGNKDINYELNFDLCHYSDILFPSNQIYGSYRSIYANKYVMDLFQNYPEMFHYAFDKKLKQEYLDTLKFYNVIDSSQIRMFINRDSGYQWQNINLWKDLITIYNEIITSKQQFN